MVTSKLNFVSGGGSVLDLDLTARTWQKFGHTVEFITVFSSYNNFPPTVPYVIHAEQIKGKRMLSIQYGIVKILQKYSNQADIFYVEAHALLYGAGVYRLLGGQVPVVSFFNRELTSWPEDISKHFYKNTGHPNDSFWLRLKKKLRWYVEKYLGTPLAAHMDLITYTNPILQKAYEDFGLRHNHTMVTDDPFEFKKIMTDNNLTEESYALRNKTQGPLTLFYSSRMAAGKGFDLLIAAFARVQGKENFRLILGGSGPEEEQVCGLVRKLNLDAYVTMPGWVPKEQLFLNLKTVDIFIQTRWRTDMTSTSLLFAMAFGLPCILPGGGGLEWVAKNSALYFKDGDINDLARKIEILGSNHALREQLSKQCFSRLRDPEINYEFVLPRLAMSMTKLVAESKNHR